MVEMWLWSVLISKLIIYIRQISVSSCFVLVMSSISSPIVLFNSQVTNNAH